MADHGDIADECDEPDELDLVYADLEKCQAENARLRAALEEINDVASKQRRGATSRMQWIARAALEDSKS